MRLPAELDEKVDAEVEKIEKEKEMPFVTGIERRAEKRGMERGMEMGEQRGKARGGIRAAIELRFGKVTPQDDESIRSPISPCWIGSLKSRSKRKPLPRFAKH